MATIAALIGRILLGALFVMAGLGKVMDPAATAAYMEAESPFPGSLALAVGVFEVVAAFAAGTLGADHWVGQIEAISI